MPCYHPMILINTSDMTDPEQRKIVEKLKLVHKHDRNKCSASTLIVPREIAEREGVDLRKNNAVVIPCGSCIGCRLDYSRLWAERCVHEASLHKTNYFLTLTYDEENLPIGSKGMPTLVKDEISVFMKRFREAMFRKYGVRDVRFFACGEYGDKEKRPHYHIILFNCPIDDFTEWHPLVVDGKKKNVRMFSSDGEQLQYSPLIGSIWTKGTSPVGQVTYESCAYVARYIVKKQKGAGAKIYADCGILPEYVRMSRRPGIGFDWFMTNMDEIYTYDGYNMRRGDKVFSVKPGKYCDELLKKENPQAFYDLKKHRRDAFYDSIEAKDSIAVDLHRNLVNQEAITEMRLHQLKRQL